jgi:hypothetical protein
MPATPIPITVRPCEKNESNAFWRPLQGCQGVLVAEDVDGLVDVSIDRGSDVDAAGNPQDRFAVVKGVLRERLMLHLSTPVEAPEPLLHPRWLLRAALWFGIAGGSVLVGLLLHWLVR